MEYSGMECGGLIMEGEYPPLVLEGLMYFGMED